MASGVLQDIIKKLLSEKTNVLERRFCLFSFLYWICEGEAPDKRHSEAAMIFFSLIADEKAREVRSRGTAKYKLTVWDNNLAMLYSEAKALRSPFWSLLNVRAECLRPAAMTNIAEKFKAIDRHYSVKVRFRRQIGRRTTENKISAYLGGRTKMSDLRRYMGAQISFIVAAGAAYEDLFFIGRPSTVVSSLMEPSQIVAGLDEKLQNRGKIEECLARAKFVMSVVDEDLAAEMEDAWPELPPAEIIYDALEPDVVKALEPAARRSPSERKDTKRQLPRI